MKKKLNQKLINLVEYYKLINANLLLSNEPIKRTVGNRLFANSDTKAKKLNKLRKKIELIKNCKHVSN